MRAVILAVLACSLRAATIKGRQLFFFGERKCTPENILATPME